MRALMMAAAMASCPLAASALEVPRPAGSDPHVKVATYKPAETYLIVGAVGRSVVITFADGEKIRNAVLESARPVGAPLPGVQPTMIEPWQGLPKEERSMANTLPLWAMLPGRSSAQVITETADGKPRVYHFVLKTLPVQSDADCGGVDCDSGELTSGLSFDYPDDRKAAAIQEAKANAPAKATKAATARLETDYLAGQRNWNYEAHGKPEAVLELAPDGISDNTQVTALQWRGNRQVPSIYIVEPGDPPVERLVTPEVKQDLLLVYETAYHWTLRKGDGQVADLYNCQGNAMPADVPKEVCPKRLDQIGVNPRTGTTSPEVLRVTRK